MEFIERTLDDQETIDTQKVLKLWKGHFHLPALKGKIQLGGSLQ